MNNEATMGLKIIFALDLSCFLLSSHSQCREIVFDLHAGFFSFTMNNWLYAFKKNCSVGFSFEKSTLPCFTIDRQFSPHPSYLYLKWFQVILDVNVWEMNPTTPTFLTAENQMQGFALHPEAEEVTSLSMRSSVANINRVISLCPFLFSSQGVCCFNRKKSLQYGVSIT